MRKGFSPIAAFAIIILIMISITGCWNNKDITDRAFVSAVGLDINDSDKVEITLQILRPNVIRSKQEGGSGESAIWVSTTLGDTVFDAIRNQLEKVNRKPFFSHVMLIVIGEDLARKGLKDVLDFFARDHEMRVTPKLLIAKGTKAKDIINAESRLENVPALHITGILENNISEAKTRDIRLIDIFKEASSYHSNLVIGNIFITDENSSKQIKDMKIEGASLLKKDKLVGFLDAKETRGYLFIKDEVDGGIININNPIDNKKKLAIEIKRSQSETGVRNQAGVLIPFIKVKVMGAIGEQQGNGDLEKQEMLEKVETKVVEEINSNIKDVLMIAQKQHKIEFFGFADVIYREFPEYWEEIKNSWDEEFSELKVEVTVDAEIDRTGIITKSMFFE